MENEDYSIGETITTLQGHTGAIHKIIYSHPKNQPEKITQSSVVLIVNNKDVFVPIVQIAEKVKIDN
jgi:hypothetical protein